MRLLKNRKIITKLLIAFSAIIIMAILLGIVSMFTLNIVSGSSNEIYEENLLGIEHLASASKAFQQIRMYYHKAVVEAFLNKPQEIANINSKIETAMEQLDKSFDEFAYTSMNEEIKIKFNTMTKSRDVFVSVIEGFKVACDDIIYKNDISTLHQLLEAFSSDIIKIEENLEDLILLKSEYASMANEKSKEITQISMKVQITVLLIMVGFGIMITFIISVDIENNMEEIVAKLSASSNKISNSAMRLSNTSEVLAVGSSKQAAAIQETSATMNEATSMVVMNAESTKQAAQLANKSEENAVKGKNQMDEMISAMKKMKESSNTVGKIVKTIDELAFQTNILAINATIEAARAGGEAGRSFAVVANEVRNLAKKSAEAATESANIIEVNIHLTNTVSEVGTNVAESLTQINTDMNQLHTIISEINANSEEHTKGIKQINTAVNQMERATQKNVEVAEENSASSNHLREEVNNLDDVVKIAKKMIRKKK